VTEQIQVQSGSLSLEIEREASLLTAATRTINRGFAKLARLLVTFKFNEGWRETGHSSLNAYLLTFSERHGFTPQTLYGYINVAEKLLPVCGTDGLDRMGITKAQELVRAARKAKTNIPKQLVESALDEKNGVAEIRALAHATFELKGESPEKRKYLDIGGFYVTEEEYKTFAEACKISMRVLGITPEMPQWQQRFKIIMFWAQEIHGTYAADVYAPEPTEDNSPKLTMEEALDASE
jgi:hypothetical protein